MKLFSLHGVLTVMAVASFMLAADCGRAGSLDNYEKVKNGMSRAEVESFLGKATDEASNIVEVNRSYEARASLIVVNGYLRSALPEKVAMDIKALPEVVAVRPGLLSISPVEELGSDPYLIEGWPAGNYYFSELKPIAGEILSKKHLGQRAVIVGQELARLKSVKVGDMFTISDDKFHVVGIFASTSELENSMVVMLLPEAQKVIGRLREITGCIVNLKDNSTENLRKVAEIIETTIAEANGMKHQIKARPSDQSVFLSTRAKMSMVCWKDDKRVVSITFVSGKVALTALVRL